MVKEKKIQSKKINIAVQLILLTVLIVLVNVVSYYAHFSIDLTEDKRFTLGDQTKEMLSKVDETIYVKVYLDGDLPAGFTRLRNATKDLLDEFRGEIAGELEYEFIDPYSIATGAQRSDLFKQLSSKGLVSFELEDMKDDEIVHKVVWPSAIITIGEREMPITLLKNQEGIDPLQVLHNSEMGLEYEFATMLSRLLMPRKPSIAFVTGHGELDKNHLVDLARQLAPYYDLERISISDYKVGKLEKYDAAIIAKPDSLFSEVDKYKIDQYIMKGGKVLWLIESLIAEMDSLEAQPFTTTMEYQHNLQNLFFRYGFRLNLDIVQDFNSHVIPIFAGRGSGNANLRPLPYYPLVTPISKHPIVKNLGLIWFQFASSIDTTIKTSGIKKTVLLQSSKNSRVVRHPHRVNLQTARFNLEPSIYNNGDQPLAVLLEGKFTSAYKNRVSPATLNNPDYGKFIEESEPNKMIVVSDGDIAANAVNRRTSKIYPLGFDPYTQKSFANNSFILNCIDYLVDDNGLFELRGKDYKLRLLEKGKIKDEKTYWQSLNLILPVVLMLLFGLAYNFIRKRQFTAK